MKANPRPKRVLLCVTGSIAAYKAASLARHLAVFSEVRVLFSPAAARLVTPESFKRHSGLRPVLELFEGVRPVPPARPAHPPLVVRVPHIEYAKGCDLVLVAPASADFLAKLALGLADDLPSTACLYSQAPLWVAPAMNLHMWGHPAVQGNVKLLRRRGVRFLGPDRGLLACGDEGPGRMVEADRIAGEVEGFLRDDRSWRGLKVLVTAGPTREALDPVRYLTNRSSGRMGYALAAEAARRGADVVLVSGPTALEAPRGVRRVGVETALDMRRAVLKALPGVRLAVFAAAVADWRPAVMRGDKIKKGPRVPALRLVENPDILLEVLRRRKEGQTVVGFAAETGDLDRNARAKLRRKPCDVLAANRVGKGLGMETDDNALSLYVRGAARPVDLGSGSKEELAGKLMEFLDRKFIMSANRSEGRP